MLMNYAHSKSHIHLHQFVMDIYNIMFFKF